MIAKSAFVFAMFLTYATAFSVVPLYHLTDLGTLGGSYSHANGLNSSGQVVGYADVEGSNHAFIYTNGSMVDLGAGVAVGIDSSGRVAGTGGIYASGAWSTLPDGAEPLGINPAGDVVGHASVTGHAFLYRNGYLIDLAARNPPQFSSTALGINNSGLLAVGPGYIYTIGNGGVTDLYNIAGITGDAYAVNDSGQIVGESAIRGISGIHAFLFYFSPGNRYVQDLGVLPGDNSSRAESINSAGEVVGVSAGIINNANVERAFLYTDGAMLDLNSLLAGSGVGWTLTDAHSINDLGWICGAGIDPNGDTHAILLTQIVPEPSCVLGVGIAVMSVAGRRRKQIIPQR